MLAVNMVLGWMIFAMVVIAFVSCVGIVSKVWREIEEYERMTQQGYKLFKDDDGKYWWVD